GGQPLQQVGYQSLENFRRENGITESRYLTILQKVADWLSGQPAEPLQAPLPQILARIIELKDEVLAGTEQREKMIRWLTGRQQSSLPPDERQQTARHLASFTTIPREVLTEMVPQLVYQAENEGDGPTRNVLHEVLPLLFENNYPTDNDLWTDLYQYRGRLLSSEDEEKKKLGQELNRRMRRVTKRG
ncbi:MAG: hypothetical protein V3U31_00450, partial [Dehalococcoidia bacterium]